MQEGYAVTTIKFNHNKLLKSKNFYVDYIIPTTMNDLLDLANIYNNTLFVDLYNQRVEFSYDVVEVN